VQDLRVILMEMPPLLRDILRMEFEGEHGIRLVGDDEESSPVGAAIDLHRADVVVFGDASPGLDDRCRALLDTRPRVKLFVVDDDGRRTTLYELRPHRERLGELAPARLLAAVRDAARGRGWSG
jgi:hypothetical protein